MKHILAYILILTGVAFAETPPTNPMHLTGSIEGTIVDKTTHQPLIGANITLPGTSLGAAADDQGHFAILNVPIGQHALKATMMGYETGLNSNILVSTSRVTQIDFALASTVLQTGEIVEVTASYFEKEEDRPVSLTTLSSLEVRSAPGSAEDIFRILQTMPGVTTSGSNNANLIVRGGSPEENLVLLDNIEIRSPLHFQRLDASMGIISIIEPAAIKNVEFMTGGFPAKYGDKASSVFEIHLKEGNRTQTNYDVNMNMGGYNAYVDGPLPGNGSMLLSVRRGIFDLITDMMDRPVSPRYWDMIGKATYHPDSRNTLSLVGFYYTDDVVRTGTMVDHGDLARKYECAKFDVYGSALGVNWRYLINANAFVLTTAEWTANGWKGAVGQSSNPDLSGDDDKETTLQLKSNLTYRLSDHLDLKSGLFFKSVDSRYHIWREQDTTQTGLLIPEVTETFDMPASFKTGGYVQSTFHPTVRFSITGGMRYDYFDFTQESHWSPRLAATYRLTDKTSINGAYGVYYQSPSALQISSSPENHNLQSSQVIHYILGLEHVLRPDTRLTIETYYKELGNTFVDCDTNKVLTNQGSGYAQGIEFGLQKKMNDHLVGSLSYTWSVAKRQDDETLPEYDFEYDRRHNLVASVGYEFNAQWQVGVKFQYASGNPYTPIAGSVEQNGIWYVREGDSNSARYNAYHKMDVRVDRKFFFNGWTVNLYMDVWNVYNQKNVLDYYYNVEDDGSITTDTFVDFEFMPLLGISVQF